MQGESAWDFLKRDTTAAYEEARQTDRTRRQGTQRLVVLFIDTDIPEDAAAENTVTPGGVIDIGDGQIGIVGKVLSVRWL